MTPWAPRLTQQLSSLLEPLPPLAGSFPGGRREAQAFCVLGWEVFLLQLM